MSQATSFTIFDKATGTIKRQGSCPEKLLGSQVRQGEGIFLGTADELSDRIQVDPDGRKTVVKRETRKDAGALLPRTGIGELSQRMRAAGAAPHLADRLAAKVASKTLSSALKAGLNAARRAPETPANPGSSVPNL